MRNSTTNSIPNNNPANMNQNTESGGEVLVDTCIAELHRQLTEQNRHLRAELEKVREKLSDVGADRNQLKDIEENNRREINRLTGELEKAKGELDNERQTSERIAADNGRLLIEADLNKQELATLRQSHGELCEVSQSLISRLEIDCNESDYSLLKRCRQAITIAQALRKKL